MHLKKSSPVFLGEYTPKTVCFFWIFFGSRYIFLERAGAFSHFRIFFKIEFPVCSSDRSSLLSQSLEGIGYQDDGEEHLGVTDDAYDGEFYILFNFIN